MSGGDQSGRINTSHSIIEELARFGHFGSFLAILGQFWPFLGHLVHFWSFWAIWGHIWVTLGHFWAIFWHFWTNLRKVQFFCGIIYPAILPFRMYELDDFNSALLFSASTFQVMQNILGWKCLLNENGWYKR